MENISGNRIRMIPSSKVRKLSERHLAIARFLYQHSQEHGYPPTVREIAAAVDIPSTSMVNYYLNALAHRGYIQRTQGASRAVLLLETGYRAIGQPMRRDLQSEVVRLLVENRRLHEQCEQLQRECDRLRTAAAHSNPVSAAQ
jgi:SOS-response transcriptional repressor LexA